MKKELDDFMDWLKENRSVDGPLMSVCYLL